MCRSSGFMWGFIILMLIYLTLFNLLNFFRCPRIKQTSESLETNVRKIQQENDFIFLNKNNPLLQCSAFKEENLKISESSLKNDFSTLISKIIEPINCSRYVRSFNGTECEKCNESKECGSHCNKIYLQCLSTLIPDQLSFEELKTVYQNESVPLDTVCDAIMCYEEYINPIISFSVLQNCFSDVDKSNSQQKKHLPTELPLFYNLRFTNNQILITIFTNLYQKKVEDQFLKQYFNREKKSDDIENASFRALYNKRFHLWRQAVEKKSEKIKNKTIIETLSNIPIDYFKLSKKKWIELPDSMKINEAFQLYFYDLCKSIIESNINKLSNANEYCCKQTAKYLAVLQFNALTSSKFIENNQRIFKHCINPFGAPIVEFCIDNFSKNSYFADSYKKFLYGDGFYKYGLKQTYRSPTSWNDPAYSSHNIFDDYSIQIVGTCER
ncbi:hypothetical protein EDEG_03104 [Edhazardia aedis USNM 41457]|uniref:Uncharacterized protein n=1 Tax=Edhazardia aedis (strain USNM 41457) TaxID=1003232 RepID=J9D4K3_EDHAE|nr:hypothetical protein EDEG_03104 [Edhazardia aedis USNM 41457]|eukprot:EJW02484.1 hypothetical protein EDEG_03104 [Edhazardia aedis USNM 41457]